MTTTEKEENETERGVGIEKKMHNSRLSCLVVVGMGNCNVITAIAMIIDDDQVVISIFSLISITHNWISSAQLEPLAWYSDSQSKVDSQSLLWDVEQ